VQPGHAGSTHVLDGGAHALTKTASAPAIDGGYYEPPPAYASVTATVTTKDEGNTTTIDVAGNTDC
jgi:hypothetical protein